MGWGWGSPRGNVGAILRAAQLSAAQPAAGTARLCPRAHVCPRKHVYPHAPPRRLQLPPPTFPSTSPGRSSGRIKARLLAPKGLIPRGAAAKAEPVRRGLHSALGSRGASPSAADPPRRRAWEEQAGLSGEGDGRGSGRGGLRTQPHGCAHSPRLAGSGRGSGWAAVCGEVRSQPSAG